MLEISDGDIAYLFTFKRPLAKYVLFLDLPASQKLPARK